MQHRLPFIISVLINLNYSITTFECILEIASVYIIWNPTCFIDKLHHHYPHAPVTKSSFYELFLCSLRRDQNHRLHLCLDDNYKFCITIYDIFLTLPMFSSSVVRQNPSRPSSHSLASRMDFEGKPRLPYRCKLSMDQSRWCCWIHESPPMWKS